MVESWSFFFDFPTNSKFKDSGSVFALRRLGKNISKNLITVSKTLLASLFFLQTLLKSKTEGKNGFELLKFSVGRKLVGKSKKRPTSDQLENLVKKPPSWSENRKTTNFRPIQPRCSEVCRFFSMFRAIRQSWLFFSIFRPIWPNWSENQKNNQLPTNSAELVRSFFLDFLTNSAELVVLSIFRPSSEQLGRVGRKSWSFFNFRPTRPSWSFFRFSNQLLTNSAELVGSWLLFRYSGQLGRVGWKKKNRPTSDQPADLVGSWSFLFLLRPTLGKQKNFRTTWRGWSEVGRKIEKMY